MDLLRLAVLTLFLCSPFLITSVSAESPEGTMIRSQGNTVTVEYLRGQIARVKRQLRQAKRIKDVDRRRVIMRRLNVKLSKLKRQLSARDSGFYVNINQSSGLITFPNKYSGWQVGGASVANYVAYPYGWSVGGSSTTNYVALPPGWSVRGSSGANYVAVPPGWSVGGASTTNYVALPPGWSVRGGSTSNFVAVPPGWSVGGSSTTNFVALPPGWRTGGTSGSNYIALPPGWSVGGSATSNCVGLAPGWTTGGSSATNYVALPPGWSVGGASMTNYVAVPPGWLVGGASTTNYVTYPGSSVMTIQITFDDPGFIALLGELKSSGRYSGPELADIVMAVFLNSTWRRDRSSGRLEFPPAGEW
jgi:hypothetical protein